MYTIFPEEFAIVNQVNFNILNLNIFSVTQQSFSTLNPIITLGKRRYAERFSDVLNDSNKSFSPGKSHAAT